MTYSRAAIGLWVVWLGFAGAASADDTVTLLATGSISAPSVSPDFQQLNVGDVMQLKYTIDPSIPTTVDGGPIVALWCSFNSSAFTDFFGNEFLDSASAVAGGPSGFYGWDLQPSHGAEVFLHVSLGDGAPAGIIPSSNLDVIPNWGLVAGAPAGSGSATMFLEDVGGFGGQANITNIQELSGPISAPEIDPSGLASGLTLLAGGLLGFHGRRRPDLAAEI